MDPARDENSVNAQLSMALGKTSSQPPPTPSKLSESGQVTEHINALFEQLKTNYEQNAQIFRDKTQKALQQLEEMETQLKQLLDRLEDDHDELMASESNNVFEATPVNNTNE